MSDRGFVLGQVAPAATTDTDLYTVPDVTQTVTSSLVVCNRTNGTPTFRIAVRPLGAAIAEKHYIVKDAELLANESRPIIIGMTLSSFDVVTVQASTVNTSFSLFGMETTTS